MLRGNIKCIMMITGRGKTQTNVLNRISPINSRFITTIKEQKSKGCGTEPNSSSKDTKEELADEDELEEMFVQGPHGIEWGGPTRGGKRPEPTRYGDWEYKGRVIDF